MDRLRRPQRRPRQLKLKLAPADNNVPYLAAYYTVSDLVYGSSILLAGWMFDRLEDRGFDMLDIYAGTFLLGWLGRTLVAALLVPIEEPGAGACAICCVHWPSKLLRQRSRRGATRASRALLRGLASSLPATAKRPYDFDVRLYSDANASASSAVKGRSIVRLNSRYS